jgi:hypothetical protein
MSTRKKIDHDQSNENSVPRKGVDDVKSQAISTTVAERDETQEENEESIPKHAVEIKVTQDEKEKRENQLKKEAEAAKFMGKSCSIS